MKPCDSDKLFEVDQRRHRAIPAGERGEAPAREHAQRDREGAASKCSASSIPTRSAAPRRSRSTRESAPSTALKLPGAWKYRLAAMLSQLGCIALPRGNAGQGVRRAAAHRRGKQAVRIASRSRRQAAGPDPASRRRRGHGGRAAAGRRAKSSRSGDRGDLEAAVDRRRDPLDRGALRPIRRIRAASAQAGRPADPPGSCPHLPAAITDGDGQAPVSDGRAPRDARRQRATSSWSA